MHKKKCSSDSFHLIFDIFLEKFKLKFQKQITINHLGLSVTVIAEKNKIGNRVQILDKAVYISLQFNFLGKGMISSVSFSQL